MAVVDSTATEVQALDEAQRRGWTFDKLEGNLILIKRLLDGDWEDDFLIVPPGQSVAMSYDRDVMACVSV